MKCQRCGGSLVTSYDRLAKSDGLKCVACGRPHIPACPVGREEGTKMEETMKTCSVCQSSKPVSFFSKNRSTPDELERFCKECSKIKAAKAREKRPESVGGVEKPGRKRRKLPVVQKPKEYCLPVR